MGEPKSRSFQSMMRLMEDGLEKIGSQDGGSDHENRLDLVSHFLQERVKELSCLYGISELISSHGNDLDEIMMGIVEIVPQSWQFPEITAGRMVIEEQEYRSDNYRESEWTQKAPIRAGQAEIGFVEVCYLEERPEFNEGPFLNEERLLIDAVSDQIGKAVARIQTEKQLQVERSSLKSLNIALKEVLNNVQEEKRAIAASVQANVDQVISPILYALDQASPAEIPGYTSLLRQHLNEIVSPFTRSLSTQFKDLTPTEIQVCNMIRSGLSTKEIARLRNLSPHTVSRHRENIRRKLGLAHKDINLVSFLKMYGDELITPPES
ncbi:MAG: LuxR family transcriptional regulator [Candidatus Krumholzibacteria bacterium]|nr:LuxR family transcriptional regulator [Candidatus Krumholzibacteria bacterium]